MVFDVPIDREFPTATLVTEYAVSRIGKEPTIRISYAEVVNASVPVAEITDMKDNDGDGLYDSLIVPTWDSRTDMVGKHILLEDGTEIGTVNSVLEGSTMVMADGSIVSVPRQLVLLTGISGSYVGDMAYFNLTNFLGLPTYRLSKGGRRWELRVPLENPSALKVGQRFMVNSMFNTVRSVLNAAGRTDVSDTDINNGINSLAGSGDTIDTFLSSQGEILEEERRQGSHPWLIPLGEAPDVI